MATLAAHGSYYRIQDNMARNGMSLADNMQRLSSGLKNVTAGSRPGDVAVVSTLEAGVATLAYGHSSAQTAVAALEMAVADLGRMSDIILRLYEMNQIAGGSFTTADDKAMLGAERDDLAAEMVKIGDNIIYKGTDMAVTVAASGADVQIGSTVFGSTTVNIGFGTVGTLATALSTTKANITTGGAATNLTADKLAVDTLRLQASSQYNLAAWGALHAANTTAAAKQELSYYKDVDFAAETSELAKNQIIAQAGTAMLAQANAQGQGILALLQT